MPNVLCLSICPVKVYNNHTFGQQALISNVPFPHFDMGEGFASEHLKYLPSAVTVAFTRTMSEEHFLLVGDGTQ